MNRGKCLQVSRTPTFFIWYRSLLQITSDGMFLEMSTPMLFGCGVFLNMLKNRNIFPNMFDTNKTECFSFIQSVSRSPPSLAADDVKFCTVPLIFLLKMLKNRMGCWPFLEHFWIHFATFGIIFEF